MVRKIISLSLVFLILVMPLIAGCKKGNDVSSAESNNANSSQFSELDSSESSVSSALLPSSESYEVVSSKEHSNSSANAVKPNFSTDVKRENPLGKYDKTVELTYVRPFWPGQLTVLQKKGWTIQENIWTKSIEKDLNIKLKLAWTVTDSTEFFTKLTSAIATNNIPDFINCGSGELAYTNIAAMAQDDMLADLTDLYSKYASDALLKVMEDAGEEVFYPATFGGRIKAFPQITGFDSRCYYWIRQDWLDNLELEVPQNIDQLIDVMKAFVNNDPDGDGKKNTQAIQLSSSYMEYLKPFFNGYGAYVDQWILDKNGKLVYGNIQPQMKNALAKLAELYKAGILEKGFTEKSPNGDLSEVYGGVSGIYCGYVHNGNLLATTVVQNKEAKFTPVFTLPASGIKDVKAQTAIPSYQYYVMKKGTKNPEALIKMFNYYLAKANDSSTDTYETFFNDKDGNEIWQLAPVGTGGTGDTPQREKLLVDAINRKDGSSLKTPVDKGIFAWVTDYFNGKRGNWGWYALFGPNGSRWDMMRRIENKQFMVEQFNGAQTKTMQTNGANLKGMTFAAFSDIITGAKPISYFDAYVADWKKAGGDKITQEVNEWYKMVK